MMLLLLFLSFVVQVDGIKKLPKDVSQHLYCLGCIATIKELENLLGRRHLTAGNRDVKIMEAIENTCLPQNFRAYEYSPPKTVKACELLFENHEEDIEKALSNSNGESIEKEICYKVSGACEGVNINEKQKRSQLADIDLTGDGSASFEVDPNKPQTFVKSDAKKNEKKTKTEKAKKKKEGKKNTGSFEQINIDINDPLSVDKVVKKIKDVTDQKNNDQKTEL
ncbi:uncharacterized protein LOC100204679 isoform X2 [Hydra vulgaris]|uniref:Uncharacterized protein LOC100204679 isoform X2 n=1 Tax=Hydra vulgaris TaxID=6087 RepID=A0ABM4C9J9_HYDVU